MKYTKDSREVIDIFGIVENTHFSEEERKEGIANYLNTYNILDK